VVAGAAVALAALGNGRYSLDALAGRRRTGTQPALLAAALGTASAAALLAVCYRPEPPEPQETDG
jgi:putative oxidoreductase